METLHAIILAVVQGITEFLPVSSSAHLILVPKLLGWPDQGLAFDVAVHVGTLFAVIIFLRHELKKIIPAWLNGFQARKWDEWGKLGWWVILATIPTGLVGLFGKPFIEVYLREPWVIATSTLLFGVLLGYADKGAEENQRGLTMMNLSHALIFIGIAQAFALIPGTSRSGVTMTMALLLGYQRHAAAKFSFLLAVPTISLGGILASKDLLDSSLPFDWAPLLIGVFVSAVFALLCMQWFMRLLNSLGMKPFVYYRILLAIVIVLVFYW
ncbi:MAG: undecaprenyl-diphosphate phosphatase [Arenicella sp.]